MWGCFGPLIDLVLVGPRTPGWLPPFTHVFENPRNKQACLAWRLATPLRCLQPATVASTQSLAVHVACGVVVAATAPALPATLPARDCLSLRNGASHPRSPQHARHGAKWSPSLCRAEDERRDLHAG